ncbi:hypothetical protein [Nonomuraea sp. NPDC049784]|uniref:hypothetical protein n=1 Tax=Nonomuraea sp. NPDC049784 TaxID=3154361 RepID=UPI0033FB94FA
MLGTRKPQLVAGSVLVSAGLLAKAFAESGNRLLLIISSILLAMGALLILYGFADDRSDHP